MYNAGTTGWLKNRAATQNVWSQTLPLIPNGAVSGELLRPIVSWVATVPSWAVIFMIILSSTAVCATVIARTRTEYDASAQQLSRVTAEIESLRHSNGALQTEVGRLTRDSTAIELAARERLGMVRPNDIIVPLESISSSKDMVSLVR